MGRAHLKKKINNVFISLELLSSNIFSPQRVTAMRSSKSKESFQLFLNFIKMKYSLLRTWSSFFIISAMRFIHIDIGNCNIIFLMYHIHVFILCC